MHGRLPVMHNISSGDDWTEVREDGVTYTADGEGGRKGDKRRGERESFAQSGMLCSSVRGREMRMWWPEKE